MRTLPAVCTLTFAAGFTAAQSTIYLGGAGGEINDTLGPLVSTITLTDLGSIEDLNLDLYGLSHSWIGDLQISLTHTAFEGDVVTVLAVDRPGFTGTGFGDSSDLEGDYNIDDEAGTSLAVAAAALDGSTSIAPGAYSGSNSLASFDGRSVAGTWTLTILDNASGDNGALQEWGLTITVIPAPGALAVAGLGGLVTARRRRA